MENINMIKYENYLAPYATFDKDAIRLKENFIKDLRPNYFRDTDRIIHSLSYTRYVDKTQVFSNTHNDHISKRIIHVQLVSKIARTIARALSLNEDLTEAIALGHDIGHVPFGHVGEAILNDISNAHNEGNFFHNVQSVRNLMVLEDNGKGKNLCVQTLDGILCHNGEFVQAKYYPKKKTVEGFLNDYNSCYKDSNYVKTLVPMTLEGCVVRISDIIGYLGRDIEDAVRLGVFHISEIPQSIRDILGENNRDIVSTITEDIINNSLGKDYIEMSPNIYNAIKDLKSFNYKHIYSLANTEEELKKIRTMFNELFDYYLNILDKNLEKNDIFKQFLDDMSDEYKNNNTNARIVIDYISGMTDDFFIDEYNSIQK
jgi:dGTPase